MSFLPRPLPVWRMGGAFHSFPPSCHVISMQICIGWFASQIASLFPPLCLCSVFGAVIVLIQIGCLIWVPPPRSPSSSLPKHTHTHTHTYTVYDDITLYLQTTELCPIYSHNLLCFQSCKTSQTWEIKRFSILWPFQNPLEVLQHLYLSVPCTCMPVILKWQVSYDACFSFLLWISPFSLAPVKHTRIQYSVCLAPLPPQMLHKYISVPPSLSLSPTHRARLLVQEDVCSAHFNMNIIILYLAAIRFSCHKPTQASSFFLLQNTARQKSRSFPHHNWNVIMLKKKKRENERLSGLQHLFLMAMKKDMRVESIFDLCHVA